MNEINSELVEYITSKYRDKEIPWHKIKIALDKIKKRLLSVANRFFLFLYY
jgi:hypothetical protein